MLEENDSPDLLSDEQVDALADKVEESRNETRPMSAPKQEKETPAEMYEFTHNGKPIKATKEQMLKFASQGYDYPQKMQKFNQERQQWEQQRNEWEQKTKVYRDIDTWASQNPQQWQRLEQLWKSGQITAQQAQSSAQAQSQGLPANDPYATRFTQIEQGMGQMAQFLNQLHAERQQLVAEKEDKSLDETISSIRDKHKDLDWDSLDESGKNLELRLLEHAKSFDIKDGAKAFQLAFKDLMSDQLIERAAAQAKLNVSRGIQAKSKAGVLAETATPIKTFKQPKSIRDTSYNDLAAEAMAEVAQGMYG